MTSRSAASIPPPSWGSAPDVAASGRRLRSVPSGPSVRWGIRAGTTSDVAAGALLLAATAGLWTAFVLAVW